MKTARQIQSPTASIGLRYSVKEIFFSIQGEGANAGRAAVFCRFSGCNLWTGRERDRPSAICNFCDTDFVGTNGTSGGRFAADALADELARYWTANCGEPLVILTGGEPLLQVDGPLLAALKSRRFQIAVETNGTIPAPKGIDWLCVSPKVGAEFRQRSGDELKVVFPQDGLSFEELEKLPFKYFFVQPMDGVNHRQNMRLASEFCLANPAWRMSIQVHKILGMR